MRVPLRVPRVRATIWSCEIESSPHPLCHIAFGFAAPTAVRADDDVRRDYGFIERWHHTRIRGRVAHVILVLTHSHHIHTIFAPHSHHIHSHVVAHVVARSRTYSRICECAKNEALDSRDEHKLLVGFHQRNVLRDGQRAAGERTRQRAHEDKVVEAKRPVRYPCEAIFRRHTWSASPSSFSMPNMWARVLKEASKRASGAPLVPGRHFLAGRICTGSSAIGIAEIEGGYYHLQCLALSPARVRGSRHCVFGHCAGNFDR